MEILLPLKIHFLRNIRKVNNLMNTTPFSEQIRIVLIGLRNAGKSSLINNIFEKEVAIVSDTPGTTTDPVSRSIELGKLGSVVVTDTAGVDDVGTLGNLRIEKSKERLGTADIILFVTKSDEPPNSVEKNILNELKDRKSNLIIARTFSDMISNKEKIEWVTQSGEVVVAIDNKSKKGISQLLQSIVSFSDKIDYEITPVEGLVNENDIVLLVTPIDLAAPKGRLILPQVETIRDLLDKDCGVFVCKERELKYFYNSLTVKPKLVITDSQAFSKVAADIPEDQMLTSFSILFARKKGDLKFFAEGIKKIHSVKAGSKILVLESCSHHRQADDIGTVKIPRLFRQIVENDVHFDFLRNLPDDDKLKEYSLVINCAGCMVNRNMIVQRISKMKELGIISINYGLFLAWANGILPRALEPFPDIYNLF